MILPDDVRCTVCGKVFCCTQCREKHEKKEHPTKNIVSQHVKNILCPLCENQPLILLPKIPKKLFQHIMKEHLPLHCKKCLKIYETQGNFLHFTKCFQTNKICSLEISGTVEVGNDKVIKDKLHNQKNSCSTQTSPALAKCEQQAEDGVLAPLSMFNLQWKARRNSSDGNVSDSISSVKNVSSIENSKNIIEICNKTSKGTLVRSTSTPMQVLLSKPKENVFDSSSCHVSSIYASGSESDISPPANCTPASSDCSKSMEVLGGGRSKLKGKGKIQMVMASPLRQVMSKSIQRAIAKHGTNECCIKTDSKKVPDLVVNGSTGSPLDLRTTPALRRSQSEIITRNSALNKMSSSTSVSQRKEILYSSQKLTKTESILVSSSSTNLEDNKLDTVYKTCHSVEVFTTEINELNIRENCSNQLDSLLITPKITGAPLKKVISFDTPNIPEESLGSPEDDVFYTPSGGTPLRNLRAYSSVSEKEMQKHKDDSINNNNEICSKCNDKKESRGGRLWSLVTSVIRLPSFGSSNDKRLSARNSPPQSLIKRCSSFAGTLSNHTETSENQLLKRKRTFTAEGQPTYARENSPKRIRKIHGRKPIERMRKIS